MGEETHTASTLLTPSPTFIVDPIDGTTNFVHSHPYVAISLGLAIALKPVIGIIYNPFTHTLYSAISGRGAFKNRTTRLPLTSEPLTDLDQALVAVEWGSDRDGDDFDVKAKTFATLCASKERGGAMVHGIRSLGSAALNLCAVAEGSIDVYWEGGCWAWDVCAGWVVLEEAGGLMAGGNPGDWMPTVDGRKYLALRSGADKKLVEDFWRCIEGKLSYEAA